MFDKVYLDANHIKKKKLNKQGRTIPKLSRDQTCFWFFGSLSLNVFRVKKIWKPQIDFLD